MQRSQSALARSNLTPEGFLCRTSYAPEVDGDGQGRESGEVREFEAIPRLQRPDQHPMGAQLDQPLLNRMGHDSIPTRGYGG